MKLKQMQEARQLRGKGLSIKQISDALNVSKASVSTWVRNIALSGNELEEIENRLQLGREHARQSRLKNILNRRNALIEKCKTEILPLTKRDLWIAGLMLYAGEGRKAWDVSSQAIELTNSDPDILRVFINFLTKVCNVNRSNIKIRLFLYPDIDLKSAENFWSEELNIPLEQFQKSFVKQSYDVLFRNRKSKYGTAHAVLYNAELYRKILGWLKALYEFSDS